MSQEGVDIEADILQLKETIKQKVVEQVKLLLVTNGADPCEPIVTLRSLAHETEMLNLMLCCVQADNTIYTPFKLQFLTVEEFQEVLQTVIKTWQISEIRAANMSAAATIIYEPGVKSIQTRIDDKGRMIVKWGKTTRFLSKQNVLNIAESGLSDAVAAMVPRIKVESDNYYSLPSEFRCTHQSSCNCIRCCR
jgi:hypothetical protein